MKTEHQFNSYLRKEFKKVQGYEVVKISDRFKVGLPDWFVFHNGRAAVVECKFAKVWSDGNVLSHTLSKVQKTALERFERVGLTTAVVVGVDDLKKVWVGPHRVMTSGGNISGILMKEHYKEFDFRGAADILYYLFCGVDLGQSK